MNDKSKFPVGTKVRIIATRAYPRHGFDIGETGVVVGHSLTSGRPDVDTGELSQYVDPSELEVIQ